MKKWKNSQKKKLNQSLQLYILSLSGTSKISFEKTSTIRALNPFLFQKLKGGKEITSHFTVIVGFSEKPQINLPKKTLYTKTTPPPYKTTDYRLCSY